MRFIYIIALIALFAVRDAPAQESMISRADNGDTMRLTLVKCDDPAILVHVPTTIQPLLRKGATVLAGKTHPMCWVLRPDSVVIAVYRDGEYGEVPLSWFKLEISL